MVERPSLWGLAGTGMKPAVGADECIVPLDNDWGLRCISFGELWRTLYQPLPAGVSWSRLVADGIVCSILSGVTLEYFGMCCCGKCLVFQKIN